MNNNTKQRPLLPLLLLSLCLVFLGLNGLIGGYLMLRDPNGTVMGMPIPISNKPRFKAGLFRDYA
jgi:hypothetical protein